jgi:hypothetical protein
MAGQLPIIFVFGSITLFADATGRLGQIEDSPLDQAIWLGNLENTADHHDKITALGQMSDRPTSTVAYAPDSIPE